MKMNDVRTLAKNHGIKIPRAAKKGELIQLIQRSEGNWDCFGTAVDGHCDQMGCSWRADCLGETPEPATAAATKPRATTTAKAKTSAAAKPKATAKKPSAPTAKRGKSRS